MEDLPPLSSFMGSTHLGTKTLWKINQPSDLFLKNPVKKGNSLDLLQRDVNLVEAKYSRIVNREPHYFEYWKAGYERTSGNKLCNRKGYSRKMSRLSTKNLLQKLLKAIYIGGGFICSIRVYKKKLIGQPLYSRTPVIFHHFSV